MLVTNQFLYILTFISALILTAVLRRYALKKSLLDIPNARSSHGIPTPRGGGLSIVLCFLVSLVWLYSGNQIADQVYYALLASGIMIGTIGFWDDHQSVSAMIRITAHFACAIWVIYWIGGIISIRILDHNIQLGWIGNVIGVLLLVWLLNLYNFMDGIDGLAAMETIFIALSASLLVFLRGGSANYATALLFVLSLASMGFLVWNWPPAKIFMGDVGSGFIGFMLAALAILTSLDGSLPLWSWLILFGVFLTDSTITLMGRIWRKERWYEAHRNHAYQIASRLLQSHKKVTMVVASINVFWLLPFAILATFLRAYGLLWLLIAYAPLVLLINKLAAVKV